MTGTWFTTDWQKKLSLNDWWIEIRDMLVVEYKYWSNRGMDSKWIVAHLVVVCAICWNSAVLSKTLWSNILLSKADTVTPNVGMMISIANQI